MKNTITTVEWEVRELDENGDVVNVDHYQDNATALDEFRRVDAVAAVLEKHTSRRPAHRFASPDTYEIVQTKGDRTALAAGGWLD